MDRLFRSVWTRWTSNATRVSPAAYHVSQTQSTTRPKHKHRKALGCFLRGLIAAMFVLVAVLLLGAAYAIYTYYSIASTLPAWMT